MVQLASPSRLIVVTHNIQVNPSKSCLFGLLFCLISEVGLACLRAYPVRCQYVELGLPPLRLAGDRNY